MMLTQQRLREVLSYDPETGAFVWLVQPNGRVQVGQAAGNLNPYGYVQIKIDRVLYRAHRLAWLYMNGEWPRQEQIDHINGVRNDNRWKNLREVSRSFNLQNRRTPNRRNASAKMLGVSQRCAGGGFQARIRYNGKEQRLGTFDTAELAHQAYLKAKRTLHPGCTI